MTAFPIASWGKRNLWPLPSGEVATRPGLRTALIPDSGTKFVGGFSVKNGYTDEAWHYVFHVATTGVKNLTMRIYDDLFQIFQEVVFGDDVDPRVISAAVVNEEILICSPDFATRWGLVGTGVVLAQAVDSDSGATVIGVPRGIVVAWCNRAVIFDGRTMYASDPTAVTGGTIRSFIPENANQRPGVVYGAHEGAGGRLVVLTSEGVFGIGADAAAVGVVGSNGTEWEMLNHHRTFSYASSCAVRGRVFALAQTGMMLVDLENDDEMPLDERVMTRAHGPRIASDDWRTARMYAADFGPLVCDQTQAALYAYDVSAKFGSWWTTLETSPLVRGVLQDGDGDPMLVCEDGIVIIDGDGDAQADLALSSMFGCTGVLFGALSDSPASNHDVAHASAMAAVGGGTSGALHAALRGKDYAADPLVDPEGFQIGTTTWESTTQRLTSTPLSAVRFDFGAEAALPTREPTLEIAVEGGLCRVGMVIDIEDSSSAPLRPMKVG